MKVFVVLGLVALATALPFEGEQVHEWNLFKVQHGKSYSGHEEESLRAKIYLDNKKKVDSHNALYDQGLVSYKLKLNQFSDMLSSEVKQRMNGYSGGKHMLGASKFDSSKVGQVAEAIDWRQKGAVTPVKNQAQCGSCWAFSTTGSLEGQHFLKTGKLVSLSEQQLVDCSGDYGNMGCNGGLMDQAFQYIKDNGGVDTEDSYGYTATDGNCKFNKKNVGATDTGFVDIPSGDEDALKKAIATVGPISVAIDASNFSFQLYSGGVYDERSCSSSALDHGVLAVGYGTENGKDYWLVKNSWGAEWGEQGYIKMTRNSKNQCGIATQASYPKV